MFLFSLSDPAMGKSSDFDRSILALKETVPTYGGTVKIFGIYSERSGAGSLSLYDYCDNDPLNVFDPDGRFGKGVVGGIVGSASAFSSGLSNIVQHPIDTSYQVASGISTSFSNLSYAASGISQDVQNGNFSGYGSAISEGLSEGVANIADGRKFGNTWGNTAFAVFTWEAGGTLLNTGKAFAGGMSATGSTAVAAGTVVGGVIPSAGGVIRQFEQPAAQTYYRVFSGEATTGQWLTAVPPRSSAWAQEALALPRNNSASFIQEVRVPTGTMLERSRAIPVPEWGRFRGGAEQFRLLDEIPLNSFGPGVPLR